jgi:hypothetical protein
MTARADDRLSAMVSASLMRQSAMRLSTISSADLTPPLPTRFNWVEVAVCALTQRRVPPGVRATKGR